jgi:heptaprenyl diphosphate synthase
VSFGARLPRQFRKVSDPKLLAAIEASLEEVETRILAATSHADKLADQTASHLARAGGKRLRPVLTLLTSHLGDPSRQEILDAAVVMEITHLGTLYHDDVMDEAPRRRGVDSAHTVWGNSIAILTGDLLFARASNIVSSLGERALKLQAETFEQLVLGQMHETIGPAEGEDPLEHYLGVLRDKTGSLLALSAQLGAMLSGADESYQQPLKLFGERIGVAFQLMDDIIDIESTGDESGKTPGTDLLADVPTLPILLLQRSGADPELVSFLETLTVDNLSEGVSRLRANPVMVEAHAAARDWATQAIAALEPLPAGGVKTALSAFAEAVVQRQS